MMDFYKGHEFDALKLRYDDQVELLRSLTALDFKIFSGFITLQLILGGWLSTHPVTGNTIKFGLLLIDLSFALLAWFLLHRQYIRRLEVIETVKNINKALGFEETGIYLKDKAINARYVTHPWLKIYVIGIIVGLIGFIFILFGAPPQPALPKVFTFTPE